MRMLLEVLRTRQQNNKSLEEVLLVRAWILHCLYTINRVIMLVKNGRSLDVPCGNNVFCNEYKNPELHQARTALMYSIYILMAISVIPDIIAFKYRPIAHFYIYIESVITLVQSFFQR